MITFLKGLWLRTRKQIRVIAGFTKSLNNIQQPTGVRAWAYSERTERQRERERISTIQRAEE